MHPAVTNRVKQLASFSPGVSLLLVSAVLLFASSQTVEMGEKLVKGPVIQNAQKDRATLTWVTQKTVVSLRKEGGGEAISAPAPVYHQTELSGLEPGSRYEYVMSQYGPDVKGSFTTAPESDTPFTFVVFGDTRTRHDVHRKSAAKVLAEHPAFVLHTGDLVNDGLNAEDWDAYFEIEKELLRNVPFYPTLGNHDRNSPLYFKYFSFPGGNGHHYSFDWGNAHIVALNSNEVGDSASAKKAFLQEQIEWLKADLWNNKKPLTFVFFHHPLFTAVERRREAAAKLAEIFAPTLEEAGVTAVFSGHDHNYQHHLHGGVHYVISGGGGAPLYGVNPVPGLTLKALKIENYVRVRVEGVKARMEALDLDGNVIDSFEVFGRTAPLAAFVSADSPSLR